MKKANSAYKLRKCLVKDFKYTRPERVGVLVFTGYSGNIYFLMGIDTKSSDLTDFAGGLNYNDTSAIKGALREFQEESLGVFGSFSEEEIKNSVVYYDKFNLLIFLYIEIKDPHSICQEFNSRYQQIISKIDLEKRSILSSDLPELEKKNKIRKLEKKEYPEVSSLLWLSRDEFLKIIEQEKKMFHRTKCFLTKIKNCYGL